MAQIASNQRTAVATQNPGAANRDRIEPSGVIFSTNAALVQIPMAKDNVAAPVDAKTPASVFHMEMVLTSFSKTAYAFTSRST